jgi:uncharacterized protein YhbP (UPF0306 family)
MIEELVRQYLPKFNTMQLATAADNQPWVCTVHYYCDEDMNFYWISDVNRRHSKEIKDNPKVTAYVLVHEDTQTEKYVIGMSIVGDVEVIKDKPDKEIIDGYLRKHGKTKFVDNVLMTDGTDKFYKLKPSKIVLFDTKNLSGNPRQEWDLTS